MLQHHLDNKGYVTLYAVLIVSAVGTAIVTSVALLVFSTSRMATIVQSDSWSRQLSHGCAELALMEVRNNTSFVGTRTSSIRGFLCEYQVLNTGGSTRTVRASSTVQNAIHRVQINITALSPQIQIGTWQEVSSF